jgi:hypothetical protein
LVPAPSEEKSTVVLVPPLRYQIYTNNQHTAKSEVINVVKR